MLFFLLLFRTTWWWRPCCPCIPEAPRTRSGVTHRWTARPSGQSETDRQVVGQCPGETVQRCAHRVFAYGPSSFCRMSFRDRSQWSHHQWLVAEAIDESISCLCILSALKKNMSDCVRSASILPSSSSSSSSSSSFPPHVTLWFAVSPRIVVVSLIFLIFPYLSFLFSLLSLLFFSLFLCFFSSRFFLLATRSNLVLLGVFPSVVSSSMLLFSLHFCLPLLSPTHTHTCLSLSSLSNSTSLIRLRGQMNTGFLATRKCDSSISVVLHSSMIIMLASSTPDNIVVWLWMHQQTERGERDGDQKKEWMYVSWTIRWIHSSMSITLASSTLDNIVGWIRG